MRTLIKNIKGLYQIEDHPRQAVCGEKMAELPCIENAYLMIEDDKIKDFGKMSELKEQNAEKIYDAKAIDEEIQKLMRDSDVTNKKGIFPYVLTRKERYLNIRAFDDNTKRSVYEKQMGICPVCHKHFEIEEMEADHITPWHLGGRTTEENCQMLCLEDNRKKGGR